MKYKDTEPVRRVVASVLQWGGWATCVSVFVYATVRYDPSHGHFAPQWVSLAFIFAMGVAIAATLVRSRMRLTSTILAVFRAGQDAERLRGDDSEDTEGISGHR